MKYLILSKLYIVVLLMIACTSTVQNDKLTEENYWYEDSLLWADYHTNYDEMARIWDSIPSKKDSLMTAYKLLEEETNRKNIELAFKYASTPKGLLRLFMCRNYIDKDDLRKTLESLPKEMHSSDAGVNIKAHLETEQLVEGNALFHFPCETSEGMPFDWNTLKGKQVLLLYGGLGCMGPERREALTCLYEQTSRDKFEVIVYWPASSLEYLEKAKQQYPSCNYIFISDFKQDASPMKIVYGCQAMPTCFLTDQNHKIVVKSLGFEVDRFSKYLK